MRMTKDMFEQYIKDLKRKNKILIVCLILSIVFLLGMTAFAFTEFHIVYDKTTTYTAEQNADTQGDNSEIQQTIDTSESESKTFIIAASIVIGLLILTAGVTIIYGKSISKNNYKAESTCAYYKDISIQQEEKEVTDNGKTDKN